MKETIKGRLLEKWKEHGVISWSSAKYMYCQFAKEIYGYYPNEDHVGMNIGRILRKHGHKLGPRGSRGLWRFGRPAGVTTYQTLDELSSLREKLTVARNENALLTQRVEKLDVTANFFLEQSRVNADLLKLARSDYSNLEKQNNELRVENDKNLALTKRLEQADARILYNESLLDVEAAARRDCMNLESQNSILRDQNAELKRMVGKLATELNEVDHDVEMLKATNPSDLISFAAHKMITDLIIERLNLVPGDFTNKINDIFSKAISDVIEPIRKALVQK